MTMLPFQTNDVIQLHNRLSKIKLSTILNNREQSISKDLIDISFEGKKRQILDQARTEVLQKIRHSK